MKFKYVEPRIEYKEDALNYLKETIESGSSINGVGGLYRYENDYEGWLKYREECKNIEPSEKLVPAGEYFLVDETNRIIGMSNIRFCLNENLKKVGGHIGYPIRPSERGKGYNKINLYLALKVCKEKEIKDAILTADENNFASWKTMEALGGELVEKIKLDDGILERKYSINVDRSIEENKDKYEKYLI